MATVSIIGSLSALFIAILVLFYRAGQFSAQISDLIEWRNRVRNDMHEISDKLEVVAVAIRTLTTLVEERTERRSTDRTPHPSSSRD